MKYAPTNAGTRTAKLRENYCQANASRLPQTAKQLQQHSGSVFVGEAHGGLHLAQILSGLQFTEHAYGTFKFTVVNGHLFSGREMIIV